MPGSEEGGRIGAQPMLGKYCEWCGLPAVGEIEVEPAIVKNQKLERLARVAYVCDDHKTIKDDQPPPIGRHRQRKDRNAVQLDIFGNEIVAGKIKQPGNAIYGDAA